MTPTEAREIAHAVMRSYNGTVFSGPEWRRMLKNGMTLRNWAGWHQLMNDGDYMEVQARIVGYLLRKHGHDQ